MGGCWIDEFCHLHYFHSFPSGGGGWVRCWCWMDDNGIFTIFTRIGGGVLDGWIMLFSLISLFSQLSRGWRGVDADDGWMRGEGVMLLMDSWPMLFWLILEGWGHRLFFYHILFYHILRNPENVIIYFLSYFFPPKFFIIFKLYHILKFSKILIIFFYHISRIISYFCYKAWVSW